jgi:hypothetical protein
MADMKTELKEAVADNGKAILRLEEEIARNRETVFRHDLDIQMFMIVPTNRGDSAQGTVIVLVAEQPGAEHSTLGTPAVIVVLC